MNEKYSYWYSCILGPSGWEKRELLKILGSEEEIFKMTEYQIEKLHMIPKRIKTALQKAKKDMDWERGYEDFLASGICLVRHGEAKYPSRLLSLYDAPYSLFIKGTQPKDECLSMAVVGARACSGYGQAAAEYLSGVLAKAGVSIISGLAYGIDAAAHRGALSTGGNTFAVLGCGVNVCYPAAHRRLYQELLQCGGILSELPPNQQPRPYYFPARNRLISGLSDGIIVVEAKEKSGSLITADCALEQGRDVYAVPGRICDALSQGTNRLLAQGASVFYSAEEFLRERGIFPIQKKIMENALEKNERLVYSVLDFSPRHLDALMEDAGLGFPETMSALQGLIRRGYAGEAAKGCYIRTKN